MYFTYYKPHMVMAIMMSMMVAGCSSMAERTPSGLDAEISKAETHLAQGELYMAKQSVEKILAKDRENPEAQHLMAQILDMEITRRMETFKDTAPEDYTANQKEGEIKTWLERAKGFMAIHQYDQATLAAEKVFEYDPQNSEASRLLDEIRGYAIQEGKAENLLVREMALDESKQRIGLYEKQAEESISKGMWGTARLAVEKILILDPDNTKALEMHKQIQRHQQTSRESL